MKRFVIFLICAIIFSLFLLSVYAEEAPISEAENIVSENAGSSKLDEIIAGVTLGSLWTTAGGYLAAFIGFFVVFWRKFGEIIRLIGKNATTGDLNTNAEKTTAEIKNVLEAQKNVFVKQSGIINENVVSMNDNYKLLLTCFTIFAESARINPNAKTEIMNYLTGVKAVSGSIAETVSEAIDIIKAADVAESEPETPLTDAVIAAINTDVPAAPRMNLE